MAGFKYVRLYMAKSTPSVPAETREKRRLESEMLRSNGNFSLADVEHPELGKLHPSLARTPYSETILGPGEMLYIPWGCWHYCRSLTASVSVNVWWNRDLDDMRRVPHFGRLLEQCGALERSVESKRLAPA